MISSKDFTLSQNELSRFIAYTKKVNKEVWCKGKDLDPPDHPHLKTLSYLGKACPNEVWFIREDSNIIVILAMPHDNITSHIIALDTKTRRLHTIAIWLNEDAEWDDFSFTEEWVVVRMFL